MLYKRGAIWWLKFSHNGQQTYFSTGLRDHAAASAKARDLRHEYEKKHGQGGRAAGVPLMYLEALDKDRAEAEGLGDRREGTLENIWWHLANHLGGKKRDASTLTLAELDAYAGSRRRDGAKGQTIRREVQTLVRGLRLAKRATALPSMPFDPEDLKTIRSDPKHEKYTGKAWSLVEINAVLAALNPKAKKARYEEMLRLILGTGLRIEEFRRVDPSWLRPGIGKAHAVLALPATATKGKKPREVPLTKVMAATVRELFPLSYAWKPNKSLKLACVSLGLGRVLTPRDLRKWFLTQVATGDVLAAQKLAGHENVKTTGIYVESDRERSLAAGAKVLRLVTMPRDSKKRSL